MLLSTLASVFASPRIFCRAPAFVSASPFAFFGFVLVFFRFASAFFGIGSVNP